MIKSFEESIRKRFSGKPEDTEIMVDLLNPEIWLYNSAGSSKYCVSKFLPQYIDNIDYFGNSAK